MKMTLIVLCKKLIVYCKNMNIKKAEIYKIRLPLKSPFTTGFGTLTDREIVFVYLYDNNGLVGIGESANLALPLYESEYNDSMVILLKNYLIPQILNKKIEGIDDLQNIFHPIRGNNFAKTTIEAAYWHLESQKIHKPLRTLWGGTKKRIPAAISIGLGKNTNESISKITNYIEVYNPKRVKIKIKPGIDIKLIRSIRSKYPDLSIMVDANSSYTLKDLKIFQRLDQYDLTMIEQPLSYNDIVDHSLLQKSLKTPICLDESITDYHVAEQAIKIKACRIVNIKPQRVGGYWQAKLISELCKKNSIPVWCGGMIEAGWGQLFNCHIATLPNFTYENDICLKKWYLMDDILEYDIEEKDGIIDVSKTDSLFKINTKKFKKYLIYKLTIK